MNADRYAPFVLQMLQSGGVGGTDWLRIALLGIFVWIGLTRLNSVPRLMHFRRAFFCLALSVLVPPLSNLLVMTQVGGPGGRLFGLELGSVIALSVGPIFTGLSMMFLVSALIPKFVPPTDAPQHPSAETVNGYEQV